VWGSPGVFAPDSESHPQQPRPLRACRVLTCGLGFRGSVSRCKVGARARLPVGRNAATFPTTVSAPQHSPRRRVVSLISSNPCVSKLCPHVSHGPAPKSCCFQVYPLLKNTTPLFFLLKLQPFRWISPLTETELHGSLVHKDIHRPIVLRQGYT